MYTYVYENKQLGLMIIAAVGGEGGVGVKFMRVNPFIIPLKLNVCAFVNYIPCSREFIILVWTE